jgi:rhodanese-related sulfurtransferase
MGAERRPEDALMPRSVEELMKLPSGSRIRSSELDLLQTKRLVAVLDVRERREYQLAHSRNTINIPLQELSIRAKFELDPEQPIALDCGNIEPRYCDAAIKQLMKSGFSQIFAARLGRYIAACPSQMTAVR